MNGLRERARHLALLCALTLGGCSDDDGGDSTAVDRATPGDAGERDGGVSEGGGPDAGYPRDAGAVGGDASIADGAADRPDAAEAPQDASPGANDASEQVPENPVFVAVGYAGLRVRSTDLGLTWRDAQELGGGGDDEYLLRAVTYGSGVFVATGFRILTSPDGQTWTARANPARQWLGGVVHAEGVFVAVGGYGFSAYSSDGVSWMEAPGRGTAPARGLAYGGGMFVASTDDGTWYASDDGRGWSTLSAGHEGARIVYCGDRFLEPSRCTLPVARNNARTVSGAGVTLSIGAGGMRIERSTDGQRFEPVYTSPRALEGIAFGGE